MSNPPLSFAVVVDRTPLHYAAASRHFQCLETLVSCGTCVNATDHWGRSAVHYAAASDLDRRYTTFTLGLSLNSQQEEAWSTKIVLVA